MLKPLLYALSFTVIMLTFSCRSPQRKCFLAYSPMIYYVGFDSTDIDQITAEQYTQCCGFDSLIKTDTLKYTGQFPHSNNDTTNFGGLYYPQGAESYANPHFNWIIKLANNAQISISNITFENNTCNSGNLSEPCFCNLNSFVIETINCTYNSVKTASSSSVYIHK